MLRRILERSSIQCHRCRSLPLGTLFWMVFQEMHCCQGEGHHMRHLYVINVMYIVEEVEVFDTYVNKLVQSPTSY